MTNLPKIFKSISGKLPLKIREKLSIFRKELSKTPIRPYRMQFLKNCKKNLAHNPVKFTRRDQFWQPCRKIDLNLPKSLKEFLSTKNPSKCFSLHLESSFDKPLLNNLCSISRKLPSKIRRNTYDCFDQKN